MHDNSHFVSLRFHGSITLKDLCVYDHIPCIAFMAHGLVGVEKCLSMEGNITLKDLYVYDHVTGLVGVAMWVSVCIS